MAIHDNFLAHYRNDGLREKQRLMEEAILENRPDYDTLQDKLFYVIVPGDAELFPEDLVDDYINAIDDLDVINSLGSRYTYDIPKEKALLINAAAVLHDLIGVYQKANVEVPEPLLEIQQIFTHRLNYLRKPSQPTPRF